MNADIPITIGFSRSKKWFAPFSWLIRLVEGTPYSHVYLEWYSRGGQVPVVYHASGSQLHFMSRKLFGKKNHTTHTYHMYINKEQYRQLVRFCMNMAGTEYGMLQILGIGLVKLFRLKKNPFADGKRSQVCSELIGYFLQEILNRDDLDDIDLDVAGPKQIFNYLSGE